ncbi:MAG: glycosyltransferase family 9 protein [Candidatus Scalindua sp.]
MKKTKILIIKLGYSETLDSEIGRVPSLGDVLRTTPILGALKEKYPDSHMTWLVANEAAPILHENPLLDRVLIWDDFVPLQLMKERFDVLINLEKISGVCALSDMIEAWVKYGFRFDSANGTYHGYERGLDFIDYIIEKKKNNRSSGFWQQLLVEMLGVQWNEQEYLIGYSPKTLEIHDIGLNHTVGSKWPSKVMPMHNWKELGEKLTNLGYTVSWQQGLKDLYEYMDWINSCRLIISNDSLGLHMAFAFKKKVIGLFGPTDPKEIFFYDKGESIVITKAECPYIPCYTQTCKNNMECMNGISIDKIIKLSEKKLAKSTNDTLRKLSEETLVKSPGLI